MNEKKLVGSSSWVNIEIRFILEFCVRSSSHLPQKCFPMLKIPAEDLHGLVQLMRTYLKDQLPGE